MRGGRQSRGSMGVMLAAIMVIVSACRTGPDTAPVPGVGQAGLVAAPAPVPVGPELAATLSGYLQERPGTWSVWVEDLGSGAVVEINTEKHFPAASTVKLPLALMLMTGWSHGTVDLDERLTYTAADRAEGTGILLHRASGGRYSVRTLLRWALTHSDNVATNMLLRRYGRERLFAYMRDLGGQPETRAGLTHVTGREMGLYLRALWLGEGLTPPARAMLLDWLANTMFPTRLRAGVPRTVPVAHKIGTLVGAVHDVGIVMHPTRPYALAVLSADAPERAAEETIARLSHLTWTHLESVGRP